MSSVTRERRQLNSEALLSDAIAAGEEALAQMVVRRLNELLVMAVTYLLGRQSYERRAELASWEEMNGSCARCKSQRVRRFSRNGYRPRSLLTPVGWIEFLLPRVRCECGGSVQLDWDGLMRPYQRISDGVDEEIRHWYSLGLSLRQLEREVERSRLGALGRRTLLTRLHQVTQLPEQKRPSPVPPVLQVDAIWVTQLVPTGSTYRDRKGRHRAKKGRIKRPILLAMGVWPEQDYAEILAWTLGDSEDEDAWSSFLSQLEAAGIRGETGLEVLIHDGGSGLCAALQTVYFGALHQRCLFHKLRNIAKAIHLPEGLSRQERSRRRKAILKQICSIWEAKRYDTVLSRYLQVVRTWRDTQPKAVAALRRDFRHTVAYYALLERFPNWQVRHLRTTSRLERFNRTLRRRLRAAAAFHSDDGITAVLTQEIARFNNHAT
jgi:putative transposase